MIPVDYELGKKIVNTCTCGCGAPFTLAWGGSYGVQSHILKCSKDITHDTIARPAGIGPYDIPGWNLFNLKGRRKEMVKELGNEKTTKLMKYEGVVSLTKEGAMEILQTIWPDAPEVEVLKAAIICHQYGLNPLMKHVFLIPFKRRQKGMVVGEDWVTVLGIKASRLIAHRCGDFSYLDNTPRVMTEEEKKQILGEVGDQRIWAITKLSDSKGNEAQGYGNWLKDEEPYGVEKGNTKANMAFIHSERNALERLFPGEMPQGVEVIDEQYVSEASFISAPEAGDEQKQKGEPSATVAQESSELSDVPEGEGFSINPIWLKDSLKQIKWSEDTAKSWIVTHFKLKQAKGTLTQVLSTLTREQAEEFVKEINSRLTQKQMDLFE